MLAPFHFYSSLQYFRNDCQFSYIVEYFPFCSLRGVSKRFKDVVEIPNSQLWNELDLSQVDFQKRSKTNCLSAVIRICRNGNLTRSLSLRGSSLTIEMFEVR